MSNQQPDPDPASALPAEPQLRLHRCKVCGTRWLLWPDSVHGGGWNLLDHYQRPGACCDNVVMGDQIEHLRDIPLPAINVEEAIGFLSRPDRERVLLRLGYTDAQLEAYHARR